MVDDMALKLKLFSRCTEVNFTSEYFGAKHDEILDKIIVTAKDRLGIAAEQKRPSVLGQIAELKAAQASSQSNKPPQKISLWTLTNDYVCDILALILIPSYHKVVILIFLSIPRSFFPRDFFFLCFILTK